MPRNLLSKRSKPDRGPRSFDALRPFNRAIADFQSASMVGTAPAFLAIEGLGMATSHRRKSDPNGHIHWSRPGTWYETQKALGVRRPDTRFGS